MTDAETLEVARIVVRLLDRLAIPYVIGGSLASTAHGQIRSTLDVDFVVAMPAADVAGFIAVLSQAFYYDEAAIRQAVSRQTHFNLIHLATMVKVDIFLAKARPFDRQQIARRIHGQFTPAADPVLWILSPEDTILAKLDWYKLGGQVSERQWRDILGVLNTQRGRLDVSYLQDWASQLGVAELLERAMRESEP